MFQLKTSSKRKRLIIKNYKLLTHYKVDSLFLYLKRMVWKYKPKDISELKIMIATGYDLSYIDVSWLDTLAYAFEDVEHYVWSIKDWDVSNIENMEYCFLNAKNFNEDISNWDTRNVIDMEYMFFWATSFNQPIGKWNVNKVRQFYHMFGCATSFNQPLKDWKVENLQIEDLFLMFNKAESFKQDLSSWTLLSSKTTYHTNNIWKEIFYESPMLNKKEFHPTLLKETIEELINKKIGETKFIECDKIIFADSKMSIEVLLYEDKSSDYYVNSIDIQKMLKDINIIESQGKQYSINWGKWWEKLYLLLALMPKQKYFYSCSEAFWMNKTPFYDLLNNQEDNLFFAVRNWKNIIAFWYKNNK